MLFDTIVSFFNSLLPSLQDSCTTDACNKTSITDVISSITAFLTFLSVIAALLIGWRTIKSNRGLARVNASLEFEQSLNHDPVFVDTKKEALTPLGKIIRSLTEIERQCGACEYLKHSEANISQLNTFLNEWERVGNGIFFGAYNGDLLYGTYGSTIVTILDRCAPHIIKSQENNERTFIRFTHLATEWAIRRRKENGEHVPKELKLCRMYLRIHHQMAYNKGIKAFFIRVFAHIHYGNNKDVLKLSHKNLRLYFSNYICLLPDDHPIPPSIDFSKIIPIKNIEPTPYKKIHVKLLTPSRKTK